MLIRDENIEYIAQDIGNRFSGYPLVEKLKKIGVPESVIVYPNTKWKMVAEVMRHYSSAEDTDNSLKILSKIIELSIHPLNFTKNDTQTSEKIRSDFNKRLAFDKLTIKEKNGDFSLVKLTTTPEVNTSTDYIVDAINYFKDEYNKVRLSGLTYEYSLGENIKSEQTEQDYDDYDARLKAIKRLKDVGFITEYNVEERVENEGYYIWDYAICKIDESKITQQKEGPRATNAGVDDLTEKVIKHEHKHYFENSIQEKEIDLNHKYEKPTGEPFYITKKDDDFFYKGQYMKLSKKAEYYSVFCSLFARLPQGGEIAYKDLIVEIQSRIPKTKNKSPEEMQKFIQSNLTDKNNGFIRYAGIPEREANGKPLIEIARGSGVIFNNKTG